MNSSCVVLIWLTQNLSVGVRRAATPRERTLLGATASRVPACKRLSAAQTRMSRHVILAEDVLYDRLHGQDGKAKRHADARRLSRENAANRRARSFIYFHSARTAWVELPCDIGHTFVLSVRAICSSYDGTCAEHVDAPPFAPRLLKPGR